MFEVRLWENVICYGNICYNFKILLCILSDESASELVKQILHLSRIKPLYLEHFCTLRSKLDKDFSGNFEFHYSYYKILPIVLIFRKFITVLCEKCQKVNYKCQMYLWHLLRHSLQIVGWTIGKTFNSYILFSTFKPQPSENWPYPISSGLARQYVILLLLLWKLFCY